MDWKKEAMEQLKTYPVRAQALANLQHQYMTARMVVEEMRAEGEKGSPYLNALAMREAVERNYNITKREVAAVRRGLSALTQEEQLILDGFYMNRTTDYLWDLMDKLSVERSRLYKMKDSALRKYTLAVYGVTES